MKFEALTDETIIVELSDDDMRNLNITYEEMDYSKVETKRVIWTVLSRARRALGCEIDTTGCLFVEAMRRDSGGCVLFFSAGQDESCRRKPKRYLVKKSEYITCEFCSAEDLIVCAEGLRSKKIRCESRLYVCGEAYRLLIRAESGLSKLKTHLNEFGKIIGESAMLTEVTDEHWHCLAEKNAVERLSSEQEHHKACGNG